MIKRYSAFSLAALAAVASLVWAQGRPPATVRTPSGESKAAVLQVGDQLLLSAEDVLRGIGGKVTAAENQGFKVTIGTSEAAFGTESRFAVFRDDLIELPVPPVVSEGKPFVPWQFFAGFLRQAAGLEVKWDPSTSVLDLRPATAEQLSAEVAVVDVEDMTKVVLQLSSPAEYSVARQAGSYAITFRAPLRAPFAEQAYENPHVSRVTFNGSVVQIFLTGGDVTGDPYQLDDPFRIVLDLRKGVAPIVGGGQTRGSRRASDPPGIRTIVLDPGHGGKEVGAVGPTGLLEKDLTLAICRKLAPMLSQRFGARVFLTRNDDSVVPLTQRTTVANRYKADLFLSVHLNASLSRNARGSETYFLSLEASDEVARKAAERENLSEVAAGPSGSPDLRLILWDLAQQAYLQESSRLASIVQEEMNLISGITGRGVKQAPFKVLVGATMPAALVEVGFISNPEEETKLRDEAFQTVVAETVAKAVGRYKQEYEARLGIAAPPVAPVIVPSPGTSPAASKPPATTPAATATAPAPRTQTRLPLQTPGPKVPPKPGQASRPSGSP